MSAHDPVVDPHCPYCGVEITPPPKTNRKCPSCRKQLYVRTRPEDRARVLCTEEGRDEIEAQWAALAPSLEESERDQLLHAYPMFSRDEWDAVIAETAALGARPNPRDVAWRLAGMRSLEAAKVGDWQTMKQIAHSQALQLFEEGEDPYEQLQNRATYELAYYQTSGVDRVRVACLGRCPTCKPLDDTVWTLAEAKEQMPIPVKECTHWLQPEECGKRTGWCLCSWAAVFENPETGHQDDAPAEVLMQSEVVKMVRCSSCGGLVVLGKNCRACGHLSVVDV